MNETHKSQKILSFGGVNAKREIQCNRIQNLTELQMIMINVFKRCNHGRYCVVNSIISIILNHFIVKAAKIFGVYTKKKK